MSENDYRIGDRILHRLALGSSLLTRACFDLEVFFSPGKQQPSSKKRHIFISGLARSGTTILLRTFYDTGQLCSLTYRNMPFVLMPKLWKRFSQPFHKQGKTRERAHGDGISVDYDSPEAFEEVFWRIFCGEEYIFDDFLSPHDVSDEIISQFRRYIACIIASRDNPGQSHYLSKNNNNILRLDAIRRAFPNALIIIPFRNPVQQAGSLLAQHEKFLASHSRDAFSRDYMRWLGHHEFGATHRPFRFNEEDALPVNECAPDDINYWLHLWINTYRHLLDKAPAGAFFVCYEDLCDAPPVVLEPLFRAADILFDNKELGQKINKPPIKKIKGIDSKLRGQAEQIYKKLRNFQIDQKTDCSNR